MDGSGMPPQQQQQGMHQHQHQHQHQQGAPQQQGIQQGGYAFGMDPHWGGPGIIPQQMHGHGYHGAMQPGTGMELPAGIPGLTASMDPLEAVLGPFPCARLRGLPFETTLEDVLVFFQGLVVLDVVVTGRGDGRGAGGEAFVVFANPMDFQMALQRDRQNMGRRYIEVFQGKRSDYYAAIAEQYWQNKDAHETAAAGVADPGVVGSENLTQEQQASGEGVAAGGGAWGSGSATSGQAGVPKGTGVAATAAGVTGMGSVGGVGAGGGNGFRGKGAPQAGSRGGGGRGGAGATSSSGQGGRGSGRGGGIRDGEHTGYLRMRGLPFSATKRDIAEFFKDYKPIESSITLTCRSDGRATGEGYVAFHSPEDAKRAMSLHRSMMGSRYIELFISNKEEHGRSLARSNGR